MKKNHPCFPDHHSKNSIADKLRDIVFGMEDGMVSTLGAITGMAVGSGDHFTVILAGCVIISVESISMGIGSYISNKSETDVQKRKIKEEKIEITDFPKEETEELENIYLHDGWPGNLAKEMAQTAAKDKELFLHEMAHHELGIIPDNEVSNFARGVAMFFSYVIGGLLPLLPYFFLEIKSAIVVSIVITLTGLFALGAGTTRFSKRIWWRAGVEFLTLASVATLVGYIIANVVDRVSL